MIITCKNIRMHIKIFFLLLFGFVVCLESQGQVKFSDPKKLPKEINSSAEEDFPIVSKDGSVLIFNRTFYGGTFAGQDIWMARMSKDSVWEQAENNFPTQSSEPLNDEYNNVVIGLSANADTVYLLNKYHHHKRKYRHHHHHQATRSGISYSVLQDGMWSSPVDFDVPHMGMNQIHYTGFMNATADVLIMSMFSDSISLGQEDLFVSVKTNGIWNEPIHMGDRINSSSFEISPFLDFDKKTLYFSSDRVGGMGGADMYSATRLDDSWQNWSEPLNLGEPVNTTGFDAYLYLTDTKAYLTRNVDTLTSDLFELNITREISVLELVSILFPGDSLIDLEPLVNLNEKVKLRKLVEEDSYLEQGVDQDSLIYQGALAYKDSMNVEKGFQVVDLHEKEILDKSKVELEEMKLAPHSVDIHFNYNLSSLDKEDEKVLERIIYLLKNDVKLKAILIGHTCDVGSHDFNFKLSKQRAFAASAYLVSQGVTHDQFTLKWKGEQKPVATNDTEEGRALNRRVEIDFDRVQ